MQRHNTRTSNEPQTRALVAARDTHERPDTTEIRALARTAGYEVVGEVTQRREEDGTYGLGRGKAEELMRLVAKTGVDVVVFDGELTPGQTFSLGELLPHRVRLLDRHRLVLDIFAAGAGDRTAALQVELAALTYELPRLREAVSRDVADEIRYNDEGDRRVLDLERRIETLERALADLADVHAERRAKRREEGFDLVALAGYTNAGKSTLLHRLADDLDPDDRESAHADLDVTAAVENRPFETLETTTRRATVAGRRLLVTDTVGFIEDLPHDLLKSFRATLGAAREADVLLLVVDASDAPEAVREKVRVSLEAVGDYGGLLLPVLNKTDLLDADESTARHEAVAEALSPAESYSVSTLDPITISALDGSGCERLRRRTADSLPSDETTVRLPNAGGTQALLAWAYEAGDVRNVTYGEDVTVTFAARPDIVEQFEAKASTVEQ